MLWVGIIFDHRTPLVHIEDRLTLHKSSCFALVTGHTQFQRDNAKPYVSWRPLNNLIGFDTPLCQGNSPDLNPIEHLCDHIGPDMV
ncbi:hypothetical protein TNCV_2383691 [Trichonephila clavipes]|nr:hypothetical protein TNCV_2383691 [Trichonephila clavipes]